MKNNYDGTVLQVFKGVKNKKFIDWHLTVNIEKNYIAFGVPHKPSQENMLKLSCDGEFYFLVKCDETHEIKGYVGSIHSVIRKDSKPQLYTEYAKRFGALYYDYQQYETIYLVKNVVPVHQQALEYLLDGRTYLENDNMQFNLNQFFKDRSNQVYLKKA